ncbi:MAG TPA: S8 family serine peptidase, partial [Anaerolineales bacterium]
MYRKIFSMFVLMLVLAVSSFGSAFADDGSIEPLSPAPSAETGEMINETPSLWFVELSSAPAADGTRLSVLKAEKAAFRENAKKAGLAYTERYAFDTLWNGLSISINPADLGKLTRISGVKAIYPVATFSIPDLTQGADPELFTAIAMTGADIAQSELGYTGAGIKVAVMDTGIDYDHPDLGGCFGPGCRVAYGYDLVGDDYNAAGSGAALVPVPDPDPDDCGGHGTHVAGIAGANGTVVGVAPDVTFGAYRVFGCVGSTEADIMIAAMEMALADGMDILNMSIGSAFTWPQYPTAQASDRLVNQGMVVVASIGNSGANGVYSAGAPGLGKKVIGVASFDNTHNTAPVFEVAGTDIGYFPMSFSGPVPTSGTEEIVYVGRACTVDLPLLADPAGKVALAVRGACTFNEKATNAINAGATGVVIFNSSPGNFSGTLGSQIGDGSIPVVSIAQADGLFIAAQSAPIMMTWTDRLGSFPSPNGGLIASSSSYG